MSNGYLGSSEITPSTSNQEIVPAAPSNWTRDRYLMKKFSFINYDSCKIRINGGKPIHLNAEQGFDCGIEDANIESFIIIDSGTRFSFIGTY